MNSLIQWTLFLVVNGLAVYSAFSVAGYFLKRSLSSPSLPALSLGIAATGVIYFAHITLVVLFLGVVLKVLTIYSVIGASVLISAVLVFLSRGYRQPFLIPITESIRRIARSRDFFLYGIVLLFIVQVVVLIAKIIILPPHIWDVFVYHLTPAVEWYQQGFIPAVIDTPVRRINGQALGMTVLNYWFFIFFRDDFLVELPMFLWALLLVPVSFASMRLSEVSEAWSQKFAILIFFVPVVLMQAITSKDHLGLNVGFFAALLFLSVFLKSRDHKMLLLAAATFGLMLGYKVSAPLYPAITSVIFLIFIYVDHRQLLINRFERLALIRTAAISVLIMIMIGGFWYIRNLLIYGSLLGAMSFKRTSVTDANLRGVSGFESQFIVVGLLSAVVVYLLIKKYRSRHTDFMDPGQLLPDRIKRLALKKTVYIPALIIIMIGGFWCIRNLLKLGSLLGANATEQQAHITDFVRYQSVIKNLNDVIPRIFDYQAFYGADLPLISGFGPQFAAFGLPALLALVVCLFIRKCRTRSFNLYTYSAVILLLVYFTFYYSNNNYRLFSFVPMILIAYAAVVMHWSGFYKNVLSVGIVNIIIFISIVWNFLNLLPPQYTNPLAFKEFITLEAPYRTSANYTSWFSVHRPSMYKILSDFPASEPIAYVAHEGTTIKKQLRDDTWTYLYYDRHWQRKLSYVNEQEYLVCDKRYQCKVKPELKSLLTAKGISLLSVCESNMCLEINDPDFLKLTTGLYYFGGKA